MFDECRLEGDFTLSSGRKSNTFYDFDLLDAYEVNQHAYNLWLKEIPWESIAFIAAPTIGGIEIAFSMAYWANKPHLKVCTKTGEVRGRKFSGQNYLIVDDVISTMGTINKVKKILGDNICIGAATFIFRGEKEPSNFPLYYLDRKEIEVKPSYIVPLSSQLIS